MKPVYLKMFNNSTNHIEQNSRKSILLRCNESDIKLVRNMMFKTIAFEIYVYDLCEMSYLRFQVLIRMHSEVSFDNWNFFSFCFFVFSRFSFSVSTMFETFKTRMKAIRYNGFGLEFVSASVLLFDSFTKFVHKNSLKYAPDTTEILSWFLHFDFV